MRILVTTLGVTFGLAGCNGSGSSPPANPPAVGGSTASAAPTPCDRKGVRVLVEAFTEAFNEGDLRRLDRLFASKPIFMWYSTDGPGARLRAASRNRTRLVSYFAARHRDGERLDLRFFRFRGNRSGYGHFVFGLIRRTPSYDGLPRQGRGRVHRRNGHDRGLVDGSGAVKWRTSSLLGRRDALVARVDRQVSKPTQSRLLDPLML